MDTSKRKYSTNDKKIHLTSERKKHKKTQKTKVNKISKKSPTSNETGFKNK